MSSISSLWQNISSEKEYRMEENMTRVITYISDKEGSTMGTSETEFSSLMSTEEDAFFFESVKNVTEEMLEIGDLVETHYPIYMVVFGAVCMIVFAQLSIAGNFISIWALSACKKLRRVTTAFVLNICVADFLQSVANLISAAVIVKKRHWNGGDRTCKWYNLLLIYFATVSMAALITITVNRFILIVYPRVYQGIFKKFNAGIIIALTWVFPAIMILSIHFRIMGMFGYDWRTGECAIIDENGDTEPYTFIAGYFFPLALFIICYAKILYVVRKAERKTQRHRSNIMSYIAHLSDKYLLQLDKEGGHSSHRSLRNKKEWRIFQMIMVIIVCYFLCFIPLAVMKLLRKEHEYPKTYIVCHLGIHLANVLNPIIYIVMSEEYRQAYKDVLLCNTKGR